MRQWLIFKLFWLEEIITRGATMKGSWHYEMSYDHDETRKRVTIPHGHIIIEGESLKIRVAAYCLLLAYKLGATD